jgi:hypothetical protein
MTNAELAELRGEIFGLKVLLFNVLSAITANSPDPSATIEAVKTQSIAGILAARPSVIRFQHLETFQNAAAGIVAQAVEALAATYSRLPPPARLQ